MDLVDLNGSQWRVEVDDFVEILVDLVDLNF